MGAFCVILRGIILGCDHSLPLLIEQWLFFWGGGSDNCLMSVTVLSLTMIVSEKLRIKNNMLIGEVHCIWRIDTRCVLRYNAAGSEVLVSCENVL